MLYQRIMIAVDDSKSSILALKEAINLAKDQKAVLGIIHVLDDLYEGDVDRELFLATRRDEGQKILNTMEKKARKANIEFESELIGLKASTGRVAEQIVKKAKKWSADLLVIGTCGRQGFERIITGSVAEDVIRSARTPVLLIRKK